MKYTVSVSAFLIVYVACIYSLWHIMFTQRRTDELRTILQRRHTLLKVGQNIFITIHSSSMALQDKSKKPVEIIRLMSGLQSATTEEMKENRSVIQYIFSLQWYKITLKKQWHPKFSPGSIIKKPNCIVSYNFRKPILVADHIWRIMNTW